MSGAKGNGGKGSKVVRALPRLDMSAGSSGGLADRLGTGPTIEQALQGPSVPVAIPGAASQVPTASAVGEGDYRIEIVPISMLEVDPLNARLFYLTQEIDDMAKSLSARQEVPCVGFRRADGRVVLTDGGKRYRAARAGGIAALRVEIREEPKSKRELYEQSRRVNQERSTQTALDDAMRWDYLLKEGIYSGRDDLANSLGVSGALVTQTVSISRIPERLLSRMKDHALLTGQGAAYEISRLFAPSVPAERHDEAHLFAERLIDEVLHAGEDDKWNKGKVRARVDEFFEGKPQRVRGDSRPLTFNGGSGKLKHVPEKKQITLTLEGLEGERASEFLRELEALIAKA